MTAADRDLLQELADRARRTETRVTKIANALNVDAGGEKPRWAGDVIQVPTRKTSLDDVLPLLTGLSKPTSVYCGDDYIMTVATLDAM
jgi:hypothetical protein